MGASSYEVLTVREYLGLRTCLVCRLVYASCCTLAIWWWRSSLWTTLYLTLAHGLLLSRLDEWIIGARARAWVRLATCGTELLKIIRLTFLSALWREDRQVLFGLAAILIATLHAGNLLFGTRPAVKGLWYSPDDADAHKWNIHSWQYFAMRTRLPPNRRTRLDHIERTTLIYRTYDLACLAFDSPFIFHHLKRYTTPYDRERMEFALSLELAMEVYMVDVPVAFFAADSAIVASGYTYQLTYLLVLFSSVMHSVSVLYLHCRERSKTASYR